MSSCIDIPPLTLLPAFATTLAFLTLFNLLRFPRPQCLFNGKSADGSEVALSERQYTATDASGKHHVVVRAKYKATMSNALARECLTSIVKSIPGMKPTWLKICFNIEVVTCANNVVQDAGTFKLKPGVRLCFYVHGHGGGPRHAERLLAISSNAPVAFVYIHEPDSMALATFSGLAKGLMVHAALQQLLEAGVIDASSNTQPLVGYYGHRDGAIGAMLAAAMLKVTYGADPQFLVLEAPHHDATSAFKQTFRRQLGVNEVDATEISACSSTTKATVVFPFVEEIYKKVSDDMFTVCRDVDTFSLADVSQFPGISCDKAVVGWSRNCPVQAAQAGQYRTLFPNACFVEMDVEAPADPVEASGLLLRCTRRSPAFDTATVDATCGSAGASSSIGASNSARLAHQISDMPELQGREVAHVLAFSPQQATYIKKVAKGMGVEVVVEQAALRHCQLPDTSAQVRPAGKISMWLLRSSASIKASLKAVPALPNGWVPRMPTELISDAIEPSSPAMHYFVNWQRTLPAVVGSDDEETLEAVCRERGLVRQRL